MKDNKNCIQKRRLVSVESENFICSIHFCLICAPFSVGFGNKDCRLSSVLVSRLTLAFLFTRKIVSLSIQRNHSGYYGDSDDDNCPDIGVRRVSSSLPCRRRLCFDSTLDVFFADKRAPLMFLACSRRF
jgi:hypothetical protein